MKIILVAAIFVCSAATCMVFHAAHDRYLMIKENEALLFSMISSDILKSEIIQRDHNSITCCVNASDSDAIKWLVSTNIWRKYMGGYVVPDEDEILGQCFTKIQSPGSKILLIETTFCDNSITGLVNIHVKTEIERQENLSLTITTYLKVIR